MDTFGQRVIDECARRANIRTTGMQHHASDHLGLISGLVMQVVNDMMGEGREPNLRAFGMLDEVEDKVTGFTGKIVARCEYATGCLQYQVAPGVDKKGDLRSSAWFDEGRLKLVRAAKPAECNIAPEESPSGGPQDCPPERNG